MKKIFFLLITTVLLSACGHKHHDEHHHDEEGHHHDASLLFTAYTSDFELYAEATPFSLEEESVILAHITRLSDFKPVEKGELTVALTVNGKTVTASADAPEQPGIFHMTLKPAVKGTGSLKFTYNDSTVFVVEKVTVYDDEHEANEAAEHHHIASPTAVTFTKEQSWKVDFATALPETRSFGQVVQTVAQVQPAQGDEVTVVAKSGGTLQYVAVDLFEGKSVGSGTTLFAISSQGYVDNNLALRAEEAKNNYETAKQNYERAKELVTNQIVSEQEFQKRKNEYENAKAAYESLRHPGGTSIASPITGYIKQILVPNGGYVAVGQPVMVVTKNKNIVLKANIPERYAVRLQTITDANIEDPVSHEVYALSELDGKIVSYGKSLSDNNFMMPVTMQMNNVGNLTSGTFVNVWLSAKGGKQALVIPKSSLLEEQGNYYVFVQLTPELFEKQAVKVGDTDGKYVEILSGLDGKQRVVTRGAVLVKLAKASGALDPHAGHVH